MNKSKEITLQILYDVCCYEEEPEMTDNIYFDLGLDSLDVQQLVIKIEDRFHICLSDEHEKTLHNRKATVRDVAGVVSDVISYCKENDIEYDDK